MWSLSVYTLLAFIVTTYAKLTPNQLGQAQELKSSTLVCEGRSSVCSVLLDVPQTCAGETSLCPIGFFFHGHGGNNKGFNWGAGKIIHEYNFIGVYPQGEMYAGRSGWNDGSMQGNKCNWDDFDCQEDPNDGNFTSGIISVLRGIGANGRVYMWGGSNGANSIQIFASDAGDGMPITGISAGWGQLMSAPPRSGPSPFNWNQPTAKPRQTEAGRIGDGRPVAQQAHHGDADHTIPYQGGARFGSKVWILMPEPESDKTWANHNGCKGPLTNKTGIPATYKDHSTGGQVETTAILWQYQGCPPTAPVEYYQIIGAPHGGAHTINGRDAFYIVFDFWKRVEDASGSTPAPTPPAPPTPTPTPTPPAPTPPTPAPSPTPPQPSKPQCCWSKWGDKDSCGNYPSGSSGAHCNTDFTKSCSSNSDCKTGSVYV